MSDVPKTAIRALVHYALELPNRAHLEYNDGAVGPASGYSEIPNSLSYPVPRPSSYESSGQKKG